MKKLIFIGVIGLFVLGSCNSKNTGHEGHDHETVTHNHDEHEGHDHEVEGHDLEVVLNMLLIILGHYSHHCFCRLKEQKRMVIP